jgi:uncharacterized protein with PIN domain
LTVEFELPVGLRDLVQSTGIPHVEVGSITVDAEPAEWDRRIEGGEEIHLEARYPLNDPPADPRFVADVHLARLARHLRLFGFDTVWDPDLDDPDLVEVSVAERRTLLTRDLGLLMRNRLTKGTFVRAIDPREQLIEILERFALRTVLAPFTRCLECNGLLEDMPKDAATPRVPVPVAVRHDRFTTCQDCDRIYWPGSHHARMATLVRQITAGLKEGPG